MSACNTAQQWTAALAAAVMLAAGAAGCATQYTDFDAFLPDPQPKVTQTEYRLAPPDVIFIRSKRMRELDNHTEMIRPDGKITLPLIGSVYVVGKTPEEVSWEIEQRAQEFYEDADVSLRVRQYNSKKVFVFGEVRLSGPFTYDGTNTVLTTLAQAQPSRLADPSNIQILRPSKDGELISRMTVDMNKMVREGDTSLNAVLEEGDIVYVPPNPLASVGLAIQQLLLPIQPASQTVQGTYNIDQQSRTGFKDQDP